MMYIKRDSKDQLMFTNDLVSRAVSTEAQRYNNLRSLLYLLVTLR